jgi:hypothetical protein
MIVLAGSAGGLARAERTGDSWSVEPVLRGRDVRGLAADAGTLYAGADVAPTGGTASVTGAADSGRSP